MSVSDDIILKLWSIFNTLVLNIGIIIINATSKISIIAIINDFIISLIVFLSCEPYMIEATLIIDLVPFDTNNKADTIKNIVL